MPRQVEYPEDCIPYINSSNPRTCGCCGFSIEEGKKLKLMYNHIREQHIKPKSNTEGDVCPLCNNPEERFDAFKTHFKQVHNMTAEGLKSWKGKLDSKATKAKKMAGAFTPEAIAKKNKAHAERRTREEKVTEITFMRRQVDYTLVAPLMEDDLSCGACRYKTDTRSKLIHHIKDNHFIPFIREKGIQCPVCLAEGGTFEDVRSHLEQCHGMSRDRIKRTWESEILTTEKRKAEISSGLRQFYGDESNRDKIAEKIRKQWENPTQRENVRKAAKAFWNSEEGRDKRSELNKEQWASEKGDKRRESTIKHMTSNKMKESRQRTYYGENGLGQLKGTGKSSYHGIYVKDVNDPTSPVLRWESMVECKFIHDYKDEIIWESNHCVLDVPYVDLEGGFHPKITVDFQMKYQGELFWVEVKQNKDYEKPETRHKLDCLDAEVNLVVALSQDLFEDEKFSSFRDRVLNGAIEGVTVTQVPEFNRNPKAEKRTLKIVRKGI